MLVAVEAAVVWTDGCVTEVARISPASNRADSCEGCGCDWTDGCVTDVEGSVLLQTVLIAMEIVVSVGQTVA